MVTQPTAPHAVMGDVNMREVEEVLDERRVPVGQIHRKVDPVHARILHARKRRWRRSPRRTSVDAARVDPDQSIDHLDWNSRQVGPLGTDPDGPSWGISTQEPPHSKRQPW